MHQAHVLSEMAITKISRCNARRWFTGTKSIMTPSVLIISYLLYWCQEPRRRCSPKRCIKTLVQLILIIVILGLVILLVALYEVMLMVQAQVGIRGIVLSLLPSLPLSAVGWYLNWKKSQKKNIAAEETEESDSVNTIQVFDSTTDEDPLQP